MRVALDSVKQNADVDRSSATRGKEVSRFDSAILLTKLCLTIQCKNYLSVSDTTTRKFRAPIVDHTVADSKTSTSRITSRRQYQSLTVTQTVDLVRDDQSERLSPCRGPTVSQYGS